MRNTRRIGISRFAVIVLCLSLLLNVTGCRKSNPDTVAVPSGIENVNNGSNGGSAGTNDTGNNSQDVNPSGDANSSDISNSTDGNSSDAASPSSSEAQTGAEIDVTPAPKQKIDDNGKPIVNFEEFVNGEWKREQAAKDKGSVYARDESITLVKERIRDILENTDISGLSEDDGLYKTIMIYREFLNTENMPAKLSVIGEYLASIEKAKTLEDLYKLYTNERYSFVNLILRFDVKGDEYGDNMLYFSPVSLTGNILQVLPSEESDENKDGRERLMKFMSEVGFSSERVDKILANALKIAEILDRYPQKNPDGRYDYYTEEQFAEAGVSVPLFDILRSLNALGANEGIMAAETCPDMLKELYTPDNFEALRDYMLYCAEATLYGASGYKALFDVPDFDYGDQVVMTMMAMAGDVLAKEYMTRYQSEENAEVLRVLTADIKEAAKQVIYDVEYLTAYGKEEARAKLMKIRAFAGKNGYPNELSDVVVSDNAIENYIQLYISHDNFVRNQAAIQGDFRRPFDCYMFDVNGFYYRGYNAYTLTAGLLCDPGCSDKVQYEERLAILGFVIAHEIGHAFDPNDIDCDEYGYINPWMKEDESRGYAQSIQQITYRFNGIEAAEGKRVTGYRVAAETFSDLMAMQICLKMLAEQENPDYDLFFRTYAKYNAVYYTEEGIDEALLDAHLPGNIRANCILSQFDEFYETYDIDENSPYYVDENDRLKAF